MGRTKNKHCDFVTRETTDKDTKRSMEGGREETERGRQAGLLLASCCWEAVTSPPQASVSWSVKWSNDETHNNAFRESPKGPGPASFRSPAMHTHRETWALWAAPREGQPQVHKPHAHACRLSCTYVHSAQRRPQHHASTSPSPSALRLPFSGFILFWGCCVCGSPPPACVLFV